jgi:hypothetical protein
MSMSELGIGAGAGLEEADEAKAGSEETWLVVVTDGKQKQAFMSPSRVAAAEGIANLVAASATDKALPRRLSITLYQGVVKDKEWKSDMKPLFKVDLRIYGAKCS